jgi:hypothetical protein
VPCLPLVPVVGLKRESGRRSRTLVNKIDKIDKIEKILASAPLGLAVWQAGELPSRLAFARR